jgi:protein-S-isoprenylcysteine O-methyltransferase Ste14
MTSFVHIDYSTEHAGVVRAERAVAAVRHAARAFEGGRGAATVLLAALVAALLVVANQVIETWTEGHLLAAWIALWTVAFAGLALLAVPARRMGRRLQAAWASGAAARRQASEDRKLWDVALSDARVMADLSRAMSNDAARDLRHYY